MLHIKSCQWAGDYKLAVTFNNGTGGIADLADFIEEGLVFAPLKNNEVFKNVELLYGGVTTWLDGSLDLAPEYLFFIVNKNKPEFYDLFTQWGYI